jgi:hypothetical protein
MGRQQHCCNPAVRYRRQNRTRAVRAAMLPARGAATVNVGGAAAERRISGAEMGVAAPRPQP